MAKIPISEAIQGSALGLAITGMLALALAIGVGRFAFTPILPMMQKDFGLTLRMAGLLASANYIGYFIGALSAIWIRAATVRVVPVSMVTVALLTVAMGLTRHPIAWLLLRGIAGILSAWILVFASAYVLERLASLGKTRFGGVVFGGVGFGIALTGAACLWFLRLSWTAGEAWIAVGALALVLAIACWPGYRTATHTRFESRPKATPLSLRSHGLIVVCYGIFGFGYIVPATFLPAMAKQIIADPAAFGWTWPIFGCAALGSTLLAGWLGAHLSNRLIWALSHGVMAIGVAMPVLLSGPASIFISACCVGGTFMVATMTGMQEARISAPDHASRLIAAMTAAFGLGQIAGPLLVSLVGDLQAGMNTLLISASGLLFASALALGRRASRNQAASTPSTS